MRDADSVLLIPAMSELIRCLVLLLGVAALSCAADYAEEQDETADQFTHRRDE